MNILYAEDSIPSQKIVKRMVDRAGVQCTVVGPDGCCPPASSAARQLIDCLPPHRLPVTSSTACHAIDCPPRQRRTFSPSSVETTGNVFDVASIICQATNSG